MRSSKYGPMHSVVSVMEIHINRAQSILTIFQRGIMNKNIQCHSLLSFMIALFEFIQLGLCYPVIPRSLLLIVEEATIG